MRVRVASAAAGTLASSFANGSLVDGVTLVTGDRILIKDQASSLENGIYTVNASGAPTRALDANTSALISGAFVQVDQGTTNSGTSWRTTFKSTDTLGTAGMSWFTQSVPIISDDTSTNATYYLGISTTTTGTLPSIKTSSSKLTFNPSTGGIVTGGDAVIHGITVGTGNNASTTNTAIGQSANSSNTTTGNTAAGYAVLNVNSSGANNTAVGASALQSNTGTGGTAFGYVALGSYANAGSTYNASFGYSSNSNAYSGATFNVAFGANTLSLGSTYYGSYSVGVGGYNGYYLYNASNNYNTMLGYQAGYYDYNNASNNLDIGPATGNSGLDSSSNTVRIGNVGGAGAFSNNSLLSGTANTTIASSLLSLNGLTNVNGGLTVSTGPNVQVGTTYSVVSTDYSIIETTSNLTVTLPTCNSTAGNTGRILLFRNGASANSIVASAAVVVPLGATAAGTAIIPATAGKYAQIQCASSGLWYVNTAN